jgi:hypothetical protein
LRHRSPLGWENVDLTGDYVWHSRAEIGANGFPYDFPFSGMPPLRHYTIQVPPPLCADPNRITPMYFADRRRVPLPALLVGILIPAVSPAREAPAAGPTVEKLLEVCDRGFAHGNTGLDAAMCEWYAAPCACRAHAADARSEHWCVPDNETIDDTVRKVVARLHRYGNPAAAADTAVGRILAEIYPCPINRGK